MDKRTLLILEYDKIIHELTLMTHSPLGCERAAALTPVSDLAEFNIGKPKRMTQSK